MDPILQREELARCREDLLYWVNTWVWLVEQREGTGGAVVPYITFDYQDDMLLRIQRAVNEKKIIVIDKPRDSGVSWSVLAYIQHRIQFFQYNSFGVGSRSEELVDAPGRPDCLFWKLDHLHETQPEWLRGRRTKTRKQIVYPDTHSDVSGYATTKDIARGGRRLGILLDELSAYDYKDGHGAWASCESATNSILAVSTHQGTTGIFADACRAAREKPQSFEYIKINWWMDPRKNEGLTEIVKEGPEITGMYSGKQFRMSEFTRTNYPGEKWSPWLEWKFERLNYDKRKIAEEIMADPAAAGYGFFPTYQVEAARKHCRRPIAQGHLYYEPDTCEPDRFQPDPKGPLKLWLPVGIAGTVMRDEYAIGCDISAGVGATPSTCCVMNKRTGEQVAQFADANMSPDTFARQAISLARWFWNATLIWEIPGPGAMFTKVVRDSEYRNVHFRKTSEQTVAQAVSKYMGWHPSGHKRAAFEMFRDALGYECIIRADEVLDECQHFRYSDDGEGIEQAKAAETDDPTQARHNHGDHLTAAVICFLQVKEAKLLPRRGELPPEPPAPKAPQGSLAWFRENDRLREAARETFGDLKL